MLSVIPQKWVISKPSKYLLDIFKLHKAWNPLSTISRRCPFMSVSLIEVLKLPSVLKISQIKSWRHSTIRKYLPAASQDVIIESVFDEPSQPDALNMTDRIYQTEIKTTKETKKTQSSSKWDKRLYEPKAAHQSNAGNRTRASGLLEVRSGKRHTSNDPVSQAGSSKSSHRPRPKQVSDSFIRPAKHA